LLPTPPGSSSLYPNGVVLAGWKDGVQTYLLNAADPVNSGWTNTGTLTGGILGRVNNDPSAEENWVLLPDNSVLSYDITSSETNHTFQAQRYIESTGQWFDASPPAGSLPILNDVNLGLELGPAVLLPNGRVFQIGGNSHTALYNPSSQTWSLGHDLPTRTSDGTQLTADDAPAAVLPNGKVLLALSPPLQSDYTFPFGTQIFEYDPTADSFTPVPLPSALAAALSQVPAYQTRMLDLPNGHVLFSIANEGVWDYAPGGSAQNS
jgi:hypothetical protein